MKSEVLTPEHEKVMAEYPGLNQRQWWLVSDLTDRLFLAQSLIREGNFIKMVNTSELLHALKETVDLADEAMKRANRDGAEYDRAGELAYARACINEAERFK